MSDNARPQKLEEQIRTACRVRHYSLATERIYVAWYKRFVRWCGLKHQATLGGDMVERWLSHLATDLEVSASTQRYAHWQTERLAAAVGKMGRKSPTG